MKRVESDGNGPLTDRTILVDIGKVIGNMIIDNLGGTAEI